MVWLPKEAGYPFEEIYRNVSIQNVIYRYLIVLKDKKVIGVFINGNILFLFLVLSLVLFTAIR